LEPGFGIGSAVLVIGIGMIELLALSI
jgi:hypothetical protein